MKKKTGKNQVVLQTPVNEFKQMVMLWQQRKEGMDIRVKPVKAADLPPWVRPQEDQPSSPLELKSEDQEEQAAGQAGGSPESARKRKRDDDEEAAAAVAEAEAQDMAAQGTDDEKASSSAGVGSAALAAAAAAAAGSNAAHGVGGSSNGIASRSGSSKAELPLLQQAPPAKQTRLGAGTAAGVRGGLPALPPGLLRKQGMKPEGPDSGAAMELEPGMGSSEQKAHKNEVCVGSYDTALCSLYRAVLLLWF